MKKRCRPYRSYRGLQYPNGVHDWKPLAALVCAGLAVGGFIALAVAAVEYDISLREKGQAPSSVSATENSSTRPAITQRIKPISLKVA